MAIKGWSFAAKILVAPFMPKITTPLYKSKRKIKIDNRLHNLG